MATQITLKIKDDEGNVQKRQHEIEDIDLMQFEQMMQVIKDIFTQIQEDQSLKQLFKDLFEQEEEGNTPAEEIEDLKDQKMIQNIINSFETLAVHLPTKAIQLLSVLSDVEVKVLRKQKMLDVMDIFDAVIEENDLERLWKRAKKSLAATKVKMSFMKITQKATTK